MTVRQASPPPAVGIFVYNYNLTLARGSRPPTHPTLSFHFAGTRDFYPEEMRLQQWLFGHWHDVARKYGFSEYDAPVLENEALYVRKAGEEVSGIVRRRHHSPCRFRRLLRLGPEILNLLHIFRLHSSCTTSLTRATAPWRSDRR